jgi:hypothetical protein
MAYKILLKDGVIISCKWHAVSNLIKNWKARAPENEFMINVSGRKINSKPFQRYKDVWHTVCDKGLFEQDRIVPIRIQVLCDGEDPKGTAIDVLIDNNPLYRRRAEVQETVAAILAADKEYSGGRVIYKNCLHKDPVLIDKLRELISKIEPH